jgi:hypothetical protein
VHDVRAGTYKEALTKLKIATFKKYHPENMLNDEENL